MGFSKEVGTWMSEVRQQVSIIGEIFHGLAPKG